MAKKVVGNFVDRRPVATHSAIMRLIQSEYHTGVDGKIYWLEAYKRQDGPLTFRVACEGLDRSYVFCPADIPGQKLGDKRAGDQEVIRATFAGLRTALDRWDYDRLHHRGPFER